MKQKAAEETTGPLVRPRSKLCGVSTETLRKNFAQTEGKALACSYKMNSLFPLYSW